MACQSSCTVWPGRLRNDPFRMTDELLATLTAKVIVVDFHAKSNVPARA
jgi:calcineurin-like phosphoesterase